MVGRNMLINHLETVSKISQRLVKIVAKLPVKEEESS